MLRTWPALFAWGAGLIHLAVGASVVQPGHGWPAVAVLIVLLAVGLTELAWGMAVLRAGRIITGWAAAPVAIAAVLLGAAAIAAGGSPVALALASALAVAAGAICARMTRARVMRKGPGQATAVRAPAVSARSRTAGLVLGAVLVAAVVTPGLSLTDQSGAAHPGMAEMVMPDPHAHH